MTVSQKPIVRRTTGNIDKRVWNLKKIIFNRVVSEVLFVVYVCYFKTHRKGTIFPVPSGKNITPEAIVYGNKTTVLFSKSLDPPDHIRTLLFHKMKRLMYW